MDWDTEMELIEAKMATSHIVVRDHSYVADTADKPEVGVFVQTNKKAKAINATKLAVGQTVWMKWSGGPIVASSKKVSTIQMRYHGSPPLMDWTSKKFVLTWVRKAWNKTKSYASSWITAGYVTVAGICND